MSDLIDRARRAYIDQKEAKKRNEDLADRKNASDVHADLIGRIMNGYKVTADELDGDGDPDSNFWVVYLNQMPILLVCHRYSETPAVVYNYERENRKYYHLAVPLNLYFVNTITRNAYRVWVFADSLETLGDPRIADLIAETGEFDFERAHFTDLEGVKNNPDHHVAQTEAEALDRAMQRLNRFPVKGRA